MSLAYEWLVAEGLLSGRSAHLITTMDTPPLAYRLFYRSPGHHAMRRATLGFCGIEPVRITVEDL